MTKVTGLPWTQDGPSKTSSGDSLFTMVSNIAAVVAAARGLSKFVENATHLSEIAQAPALQAAAAQTSLSEAFRAATRLSEIAQAPALQAAAAQTSLSEAFWAATRLSEIVQIPSLQAAAAQASLSETFRVTTRLSEIIQSPAFDAVRESLAVSGLNFGEAADLAIALSRQQAGEADDEAIINATPEKARPLIRDVLKNQWTSAVLFFFLSAVMALMIMLYQDASTNRSINELLRTEHQTQEQVQRLERQLSRISKAAASRPLRVVPDENGELRVPPDVAEVLGPEAKLEVGPGPIVILRPGKLKAATLVTGVEPLDDPARLRHARSPLTPEERAALADFLGQ